MKYINVLLCALLLTLAGCSDIMGPPTNGQNEGGLKITVSSDIAGSRTLFPKTDFTKYVLSFSGPESYADITMEDGETSVLVDDLAAGSWTITVRGFVKIKDIYGVETEYEAAQGSGTVNVGTGPFQSLNLVLRASKAGDDGFFSYSVDFPASRVDDAELLIYPFGSSEWDGDGQSIDLKASSSGIISLSPGYYMMSVRLYNQYQTAGHTEVVHIYSNMETEAKYTLTDADFINIITLSGTVDVKVGGATPGAVTLYVGLDEDYLYRLAEIGVDLSDNTWSVTMAAFDTETPLYFIVGAYVDGCSLMFEQKLGEVVKAEGQSIPGINLGTVDVSVITLSGTINITCGGKPVSNVEIKAVNEYGTYGTIWLSSPGANAPWSMIMPPSEYTTTVTFTVDGYDDNWDQLFSKSVENLTVSFNNQDRPGIAIDPGDIPNPNTPVDSVLLSENTWVSGAIAAGGDINWYSINVTSGTSYYLWWLDSNWGKYNLVDVYAWDDDGSSISISSHYDAWNYPSLFTAQSNGTVYFRVRALYGGSSTGTYEIVYNTDGTRPNIDFSGSLTQKLRSLRINAVSGGSYTIELDSDEIITPQNLYYKGEDVTVTLKGDTTERTVSLNGNGSLFTVESGVTLILDNNITLRGHNDNTAPLVSVDYNGSLLINAGAKITGNTSKTPNLDYARGGGVSVVYGNCIMNGGEISHNTSYGFGGGMYVDASGSFTMYDGKITHNTAKSPGIGYASNGGGMFIGSSFTMSGGEISYNTVVDDVNFVYAEGSGIYGAYADITMNDGSINNNTGGSGVTLNTQCTFTMNGGNISNNDGGNSGGGVALQNDCSFDMTGGEISGNTAAYSGGGVYVDAQAIFSKTGGTIYGYTAGDGNSNAVKDVSGMVQNGQGHAVYARNAYGSNSNRKETTAGPNVDLFYNSGAASGDWDNNGSGSTQEYNVNVMSATGGTIMTNPPGNVAANTSVYINVYPDPGYTLKSISVTNDSTGNSINTTTATGGGYYFVMPASDVTIIAEFETGGSSGITVTFNSNGGTDVASITVSSGSTIAAPTAPTSGYGTFAGWCKDEYLFDDWDFSTDTVTGNITLYARWQAHYELGETGPGGGFVFYSDPNGFTFYMDADDTKGTTAYYLEAAPDDMSTLLAWASSGYYTTDISDLGYGIGEGKKNTALILASDANAPASKACADYSNNGKNDWFLPSYNEIYQLYLNRAKAGDNFGTHTYWSSSQSVSSTNQYAYNQSFTNGVQNSSNKMDTYYVRAVRAF